MSDACAAAEAMDEKSHQYALTAAGLGVVALVPEPAQPYIAALAALYAAAAYDASRRADELEKLCDLEKARREQQDSDDGSTGGSGAGGGGDVLAGAGASCDFISYGGYTTTTAEGGIIIVGATVKWTCAPLALDLDRDGIEYRTLDDPIRADFDGDGRYSDYSWISPDDGLIVYDDNMDGIGQKDEWVLTTFVHGAETDLEALRAFDSNGNGILNANDALWAKLKVGRDLNQNGRFDAGELATFAEHGITRVNLEQNVTAVSTPDAPSETAPGVFTFNTGIFYKDGVAHQFADVALEKVAFAEQVYSDADKTIVSYGGTQAWVHTGADVSFNLATRTHGGKGFVDFFGDEGTDVVSGSEAANTIAGGGGADRLSGAGGDDMVIADRADCYAGLVRGGDGFDTLVLDAVDPVNLDVGGSGFEMASGGEGDDVLWTSTGTFGPQGVTLLGAGGGDWRGVYGSLVGGLSPRLGPCLRRSTTNRRQVPRAPAKAGAQSRVAASAAARSSQRRWKPGAVARTVPAARHVYESLVGGLRPVWAPAFAGAPGTASMCPVPLRRQGPSPGLPLQRQPGRRSGLGSPTPQQARSRTC
jgi:hypothetical protein